ncbi:MAG: Cysteine desulfurase, partial [uncultured Gemmatimonadetes bacterium]
AHGPAADRLPRAARLRVRVRRQVAVPERGLGGAAPRAGAARHRRVQPAALQPARPARRRLRAHAGPLPPGRGRADRRGRGRDRAAAQHQLRPEPGRAVPAAGARQAGDRQRPRVPGEHVSLAGAAAAARRAGGRGPGGFPRQPRRGAHPGRAGARRRGAGGALGRAVHQRLAGGRRIDRPCLPRARRLVRGGRHPGAGPASPGRGRLERRRAGDGRAEVALLPLRHGVHVRAARARRTDGAAGGGLDGHGGVGRPGARAGLSRGMGAGRAPVRGGHAAVAGLRGDGRVAGASGGGRPRADPRARAGIAGPAGGVPGRARGADRQRPAAGAPVGDLFLPPGGRGGRLPRALPGRRGMRAARGGRPAFRAPVQSARGRGDGDERAGWVDAAM